MTIGTAVVCQNPCEILTYFDSGQWLMQDLKREGGGVASWNESMTLIDHNHFATTHVPELEFYEQKKKKNHAYIL